MKKKSKVQKAAKTKFNVPAIYLGERVEVLSGIRHVFRTPAGDILRFKGLRGHLWYGDIYLTSSEGSIQTRPEKAPYEPPSGLEPTKRERIDYEVHKELAKDYRLRNRKAMELKKPHADIVKALELLRPFMRGADTYTLRRFAGYIENQLSKKGKRK
ncbi:MAG: hypothetical protein WC130_04930 [Kiritimatiellia bacterium]